MTDSSNQKFPIFKTFYILWIKQNQKSKLLVVYCIINQCRNLMLEIHVYMLLPLTWARCTIFPTQSTFWRDLFNIIFCCEFVNKLLFFTIFCRAYLDSEIWLLGTKSTSNLLSVQWYRNKALEHTLETQYRPRWQNTCTSCF